MEELKAATKEDNVSKILIFDIDDTLIKTNAKIKVVKDGKVIKELSPAAYNDYTWHEGESFDYSSFDDIYFLKTGTLTKYWDTLKREYKKGTQIAILTARSRPVMVRKFFASHGIDIDKDFIFCCGYSKYPWKGSTQIKKAKTIEHLIKMGYETFVFFDDNKGNLESVKKLENEYKDIKIILNHVIV